MGNAAVVAPGLGSLSSSSGSNNASSRLLEVVRQPPSLVWSEEDDEDGDGHLSESSAHESMEIREETQQRVHHRDTSSAGSGGNRRRVTLEYDSKCFLFSVPSICRSSRRPSILVIDSGRLHEDEEDDDDDEDRDDGGSDSSSNAAMSSPADAPSLRSPLSSCYPSTPSPLSSSSASSASPSSESSSKGLLLRYSSSYSSMFDPLEYTADELELSATTPTPESDLGRPHRSIHIVTTAALPWMTGTAINPLLRAKYLSQSHENVTLVVPWLESPEDRVALYGEEWRDRTVEDHTSYLQTQWLQNSTVSLLFYPAKYHSQLSSIFALGDLCELLPTCEDGVCILEEPEHGTWRPSDLSTILVRCIAHFLFRASLLLIACLQSTFIARRDCADGARSSRT
jgi:hypothetical protein